MPGAAALAENPWIGERAIADTTRRAYLVGLDDGEAEAIVLAEESQARLLILDEALARRHARLRSLTITGTVGVLVRARLTGRLERVDPALRALRDSGFHVGDELVRAALRLAGELSD